MGRHFRIFLFFDPLFVPLGRLCFQLSTTPWHLQPAYFCRFFETQECWKNASANDACSRVRSLWKGVI